MKNRTTNENVVKRKSKVWAVLLIALAIAVLLAGLAVFISFMLKNSNNTTPTVRKIYSAWEKGDYQKVYDDSNIILENNHLNIPSLVMHGYSSFFIALSQTDITNTQLYIDECISSLRLAMYYADKSSMPQINYMLGKAYFQKNSVSSYYYYSDLVIKYLSLASDEGYEAPDIHECMGLCYADLGMTMESVMEFTRALKERKSDTLMYAIAVRYHKMDKNDIAKPYLTELLETSQDDDIILKSSLLLADMNFAEGNYEQAKNGYEKILEKYPDCADALYGMGNIYEKNGDIAKARSEWRKTLKVSVNHYGAIKKLGL